MLKNSLILVASVGLVFMPFCLSAPYSNDATASVTALIARVNSLDNQANETDETYQKLMLNDLPNLLEDLELHKDFADALQLAQVKLDTATRLFGPESMTALDAMQDLIFLAVQEQAEQKRQQYLSKYVATVEHMRKEHKMDIVDVAFAIRSQRLQRKLRAAAATLNVHI
jgi:hypothetical protein